MKEQIHIFDTTLRDGEQCPGAAMNVEQKIQVAMQLETLGVDIIEAGFPLFQTAISELSGPWRNARKKPCLRAGPLREKDIAAAHEALKVAGERERIHLVVATSPSTGNTSWEKPGTNQEHGRKVRCHGFRFVREDAVFRRGRFPHGAGIPGGDCKSL